jgi:DNA-directed RNA polymerase
MFEDISSVSMGKGNIVEGTEHIIKLGLAMIQIFSKAEVLNPDQTLDQNRKKLSPTSTENPKVLLHLTSHKVKRNKSFITSVKVSMTESAIQDLASVNFAPVSELAPGPMLTPPRPWINAKKGGYFDIKTSFLRVRESKYQSEVLNNANLDRMFHAANALGSTPWTINKEIYNYMMQCWDRKIKIGKIPSRLDFEVPTIEGPDFENASREEKRRLRNQYKEANRKNAELHSLRCDFLLRVNVAKDLLDDIIYFPYNFDFRGRAYPIPPHLNHIGSDIARALLTVCDYNFYCLFLISI